MKLTQHPHKQQQQEYHHHHNNRGLVIFMIIVLIVLLSMNQIVNCTLNNHNTDNLYNSDNNIMMIQSVKRIYNTNFMYYHQQYQQLYNKLYNNVNNNQQQLELELEQLDYIILSQYDNNSTSISQSNSSSTANTTSIYGDCNPILFELGNFSRDGPNIMYGICPDTWLTPAISIVFLVFYLIALIVCGIYLFLKRKSPHVKARNLTYMFMTIISNSGFIIIICLRFIIGRRIYPCSIYILSYFIIPPGILLPSIFRLWRLYFMYKENLQKMKMNEYKQNEKINNLNFTNNNLNNNNSNFTNASSVSNKTKSQIISSSINGNTITNNSNSNTFSDIDTESTDDTNSYWNDYELEFKKHEKLHKLYSFLLSNKFVIVSYLISFCLHILLFIILGSIEEGIYNRNPNKPRVFLGDGGFFVSTNGCVINNSIVIILAVEAIFYIIVEIVFLVLSFITPRDTWFIKRETLVLITLQFLAIILFAICGFLDEIANFTDYFVPFGFVLMTYSFVEVIVCVLFPILVYSKNKKKDSKDSELEQFLMNKRTLAILLDFARRSYCPESVLCYRDIERYKLTNKKHRKKAALKITKTYLKPGSPLELNFPKLQQTFDEFSQIINSSSNNVLETSLFETIQLHCLDDMRDVFDRLKNQSKETRQILEQWKLQQQLQHSEMDDLNINMNNMNNSNMLNGNNGNSNGMVSYQQSFEEAFVPNNVESIDLSNINSTTNNTNNDISNHCSSEMEVGIENKNIDDKENNLDYI